MKKKRKILSIFSGVCGLCAICSALCCSLFLDDHNKAIKTNASMSLTDLEHANVEFNSEYTANDFNSVFNYYYGLIPSSDIESDGTFRVNFDYFLNGYQNSRFFEVLRITLSDVIWWPDPVSPSHWRRITFYFGTEQEFIHWESTGAMGRYCCYYTQWLDGSNVAFDYDFDVGEGLVLNFVNGNDIRNVEICFVLNTFCDLLGYNDYTIENISISQYQSMIEDLQREINYLQGQIELQASNVDDAYYNGYMSGYNLAQSIGETNTQNAYTQGYSDGYASADTSDEVVVSIFSGILQVGLLPINFFLQIFNFDILGINLSAFIRAIFTVVLTIIVLKTVLGKGGGGSDS